MKNVPIKFRGYDTQDGVREMVTFTLDDLLAGSDEYELIDPESVAQLVGYDANGEEVYEGDKIQDLATGDVITAKLCPCNFYEIGITTAYFKKVGTNND